MKPELSKLAFWAAAAGGAVCVLVLATLTFQSLFRLFGAQPEKEKAMPEEKAIPAAAEQASPGQNVKLVSDVEEPPYVNPAPAPKAPASGEFCTDSELIRQQERKQQERLAKQRKLTGQNRDSKSVLPTEQLKPTEPARDI